MFLDITSDRTFHLPVILIKKRISPEPNKYFKNHFPLFDLAGWSQDSSQHLLVQSILSSFTVFSDKMSDYLKIARKKRNYNKTREGKIK